LVFASDDQLLQVGTGTVDDIQIMIDGNIPVFPQVTSRSSKITCSEAHVEGSAIEWSGQILNGQTIVQSYIVSFNVVNENYVDFNATLTQEKPVNDSFFAMGYISDADEEIYGMGLQYTIWDFKGR
jgi:hypothetical protein